MTDASEPGPLTLAAVASFPQPQPGFPLAVALSAAIVDAYASLSGVALAMGKVQETIGARAAELVLIARSEGNVQAALEALDWNAFIESVNEWASAPTYAQAVGAQVPAPAVLTEINPAAQLGPYTTEWWRVERLNVSVWINGWLATLP